MADVDVDGQPGGVYAWIRLPLQGLFIAWALISTAPTRAEHVSPAVHPAPEALVARTEAAMSTDAWLAIAHHLAVFSVLALLSIEWAIVRPGLGGRGIKLLARVDARSTRSWAA